MVGECTHGSVFKGNGNFMDLCHLFKMLFGHFNEGLSNLIIVNSKFLPVDFIFIVGKMLFQNIRGPQLVQSILPLPLSFFPFILFLFQLFLLLLMIFRFNAEKSLYYSILYGVFSAPQIIIIMFFIFFLHLRLLLLFCSLYFLGALNYYY